MEKYLVVGKEKAERDEKKKLRRIHFNPPKVLHKEQLERRQRIKYYNTKTIYSKIASLVFEKIDKADRMGKDNIVYNIPRYYLRNKGYNEIECASYVAKQVENADYKPILGKIRGGGLALRISWKSIRTLTHSQKSEVQVKKRLSETRKIMSKYQNLVSGKEKQLLLIAPPPSFDGEKNREKNREKKGEEREETESEEEKEEKEKKQEVDVKGLMLDYELLKQEKDTFKSNTDEKTLKYERRMELMDHKIKELSHDLQSQKRMYEARMDKAKRETETEKIGIEKGLNEKITKFKFEAQTREKMISNLERIIESLTKKKHTFNFGEK